MSTFNKSDIPASTSFVLRWSDLPGGVIVCTAFEDKKDDKGAIVGAELARMVFHISEASESNTKMAALYGFKKKLQDDAAQITTEKGFTLRDKMESYAGTWDVMKSDSWKARRPSGSKVDLYRLAGAIALGNGQPLEKAFAIQVRLQSKTKDEIAALCESDAARKGFPLFDAMMADADEIDLG